MRTYAARYSRPLLEAIDWCLQMDQLDRPQTVQQLLDAFEQPAAPEPEKSVLDRLRNLSWLNKKQAG